ncbi:MAG: 2-phospho-L-lactate guanylyltransferase [Paracoccaceae bacterium]|jgi:2-phospho-L-lactate guanylyltransferase|nr:2-phospho-L-lactate guanylyltransferase [Paracoccaceae bacterium]
MQKTLIIVPMKQLSDAKSRLKSSASNRLRVNVAKKLLDQTLSRVNIAIEKCKETHKLAVLTECDEVRSFVKKKDILVINSSIENKLSDSLFFGVKWAKANGFSSACIIPADLGDPSPDELNKFILFPIESNSMVICPSKDLGTNALLISPPDAIAFRYGKDSFQKHIDIANKNKIRTSVLELKSLTFDIDTMEDLNKLLIKSPDFLSAGKIYND